MAHALYVKNAVTGEFERIPAIVGPKNNICFLEITFAPIIDYEFTEGDFSAKCYDTSGKSIAIEGATRKDQILNFFKNYPHSREVDIHSVVDYTYIGDYGIAQIARVNDNELILACSFFGSQSNNGFLRVTRDAVTYTTNFPVA